ncbi:MAG: hypothetical protein Q7T50_03670, partial [Candidatus Magasanikbacteria bacterium]|nr:hypothetical protein [Candidatus Magasanikbacteria bacterium]
TVAVGAYYAVSRSFDVYALTHPSLSVDYQYKINGNSTSLTYDQTTSSVTSQYNRMAIVYNGAASTATTFPISIFSARYYTNTSIRLERRRSGANFPAWTQGINFSGIMSPATYPTDRPSIYPVASYDPASITNWSSFTETATKNGGEIYYQISSDNGVNWRYWSGSGWAAATLPTHSSTASVINANIASYGQAEMIKFRAFLQSNGSQLVQLSNIYIGVNSPPGQWSYSTWGIDGGEVTPVGTTQTSGGNPGNFAKIAVPVSTSNEVGGYFQNAVNITSSDARVSVDFDYSVIDFTGVPASAQIRVYLDSTSGTPVNQVGSSIGVTALKTWTGATTIDASSAAASPGTYYLKIAFWVESGTNTGPYSVGFDNVVLNWDATGYPTTSPTIVPTSAYSVVNLDKYSSFTESATKAGTGEIYYQLSDNGGASWQYWNGLVWGIAGPSDYNIASAINTNISSFATTTASIIFKAFLVSNGTDQVQLDNVRIGWEEPGVGNSGFQVFGSLLSSAFNMSDASPVQIIEWSETSVAGGDVKLQLRTAPDASGVPGVWTSWYGASGADTFYTVPGQYLIPTSMNGNQWMQYRVELSGDGVDTPILENVKINYK